MRRVVVATIRSQQKKRICKIDDDDDGDDNTEAIVVSRLLLQVLFSYCLILFFFPFISALNLRLYVLFVLLKISFIRVFLFTASRFFLSLSVYVYLLIINIRRAGEVGKSLYWSIMRKSTLVNVRPNEERKKERSKRNNIFIYRASERQKKCCVFVHSPWVNAQPYTHTVGDEIVKWIYE